MFGQYASRSVSCTKTAGRCQVGRRRSKLATLRGPPAIRPSTYVGATSPSFSHSSVLAPAACCIVISTLHTIAARVVYLNRRLTTVCLIQILYFFFAFFVTIIAARLAVSPPSSPAVAPTRSYGDSKYHLQSPRFVLHQFDDWDCRKSGPFSPLGPVNDISFFGLFHCTHDSYLHLGPRTVCTISCAISFDATVVDMHSSKAGYLD